MRKVIAVALVLALIGAGALVFLMLEDSANAPGETLPTEARAAAIFARTGASFPQARNDDFYGWRAPFDCRRTDGDGSINHLLDDIDFVCTPRLRSGKACRVGQCAGWAVDLSRARVKHYVQIGMP